MQHEHVCLGCVHLPNVMARLQFISRPLSKLLTRDLVLPFRFRRALRLFQVSAKSLGLDPYPPRRLWLSCLPALFQSCDFEGVGNVRKNNMKYPIAYAGLLRDAKLRSSQSARFSCRLSASGAGGLLALKLRTSPTRSPRLPFSRLNGPPAGAGIFS